MCRSNRMQWLPTVRMRRHSQPVTAAASLSKIPTEHLQLEEQEQEVRERARVLEKTFADFGFKVRVVEIETGPVISQYEIELEAGLRLPVLRARGRRQKVGSEAAADGRESRRSPLPRMTLSPPRTK
jgi:hypothetical protein